LKAIKLPSAAEAHRSVLCCACQAQCQRCHKCDFQLSICFCRRRTGVMRRDEGA